MKNQPKLWMSVYFDAQYAFTKFENLITNLMDEPNSSCIGSGTDGMYRDIQFEYNTQREVDRVMKKVNEIASTHGVEVRFEVKDALC